MIINILSYKLFENNFIVINRKNSWFWCVEQLGPVLGNLSQSQKDQNKKPRSGFFNN